MSDPNYTALLMIVDRSGSMQEIRLPMIEGMGLLLSDQAAEPGLLTVDVVEFDDEMQFTHRFDDPASVAFRIEPRGRTALYDAIAFGITDLSHRIGALPSHAKPSKTIVVVVTDGHENASVEFDADLTKSLIQIKTAEGWEFLYLGANQDAVLEAGEIGIADAVEFRATPEGVRGMTTEASARLRTSRQAARDLGASRISDTR